MIEDARQIPPGSTVSADVCIIGAGAAGITIARELANSALEVVVLVGGGHRERPQDRDMYRGSVAPDSPHEPIEENRRRAWGGTTALWGGRCIPLDPIDFEQRDYVPHSGWPLSYADLLPYYRRANVVCEAGAFEYEAAEALPGRQSEMIAGFDGTDVVSTRLERWSPPTNFARRYGPELRNAPNVRVLMYASAVHLQLAPDRQRLASVKAACGPGAEFDVTANDYVLACGGLENARLLLASNDVAPGGVGNENDNVGRYYMSHLSGVVAGVELRDADHGFTYGFDRDDEGVYVRRRLWVTAAAQSQAKIGNCTIQFDRPNIANAGHRSALFSSTYLAKTYLGALRTRSLKGARESLRSEAGALKEHWNAVVRGFPQLLPEAVHLVKDRWLAKRRLPIVLGTPSGNHFELLFVGEHTPNPESRVSLSAERDAMGMPRLSVHVAFSDLDVDTVVGLHEIIAARFTGSGTGQLRYETGDIRAKLTSYFGEFNSAAHHIGTTRMARRPEDGVVDRDSRVFGVDNLFVAGSSVFPTGGHANPTLTIVALALRLADHLKQPQR